MVDLSIIRWSMMKKVQIGEWNNELLWKFSPADTDELERVKYEEGIEEGLDEGIRGTVSALKKLNIPLQNISAIIQEEYKLSLETAKKYI